MTGLRLLPSGEQALLAEVADTAAVLALHRRLTDDPPPGVVELVPGARTLLVATDGQASPDEVAVAVRARWARVGDGPVEAGNEAEPVVLPVVYDGPDLDQVARLTGLSVDEVVTTHIGADWRVAFVGFSPGFGYLSAVGDPLSVPRRPDPRSRVPPGSVGLAGTYSGVYPTASPGGWQLLGRTEVVLFDPDRRPPALLVPGRRVRFEAVG